MWLGTNKCMLFVGFSSVFSVTPWFKNTFWDNSRVGSQSELRFGRFGPTLWFSRHEVNSTEQKPAQKELLRYLRLGKSVRSRNGANHVRNFILEAQLDPVIHRLFRTYGMRVVDICLACTEVLDPPPDSPHPDASDDLASMLLFSDPVRIEAFLRKLHQATHGQTAIQRRLAIIACAKAHAGQAGAPVTDQRPPATRSNLLKTSIFNNLLLLMLIAGLVIAGLLVAIFLL